MWGSTVVGFESVAPRVHEAGRRIRFARRARTGGIGGGGRRGGFARSTERLVEWFGVYAVCMALAMGYLGGGEQPGARRFAWGIALPVAAYLVRNAWLRRVDLVFGRDGVARRGRGESPVRVVDVTVEPSSIPGMSGWKPHEVVVREAGGRRRSLGAFASSAQAAVLREVVASALGLPPHLPDDAPASPDRARSGASGSVVPRPPS